MADAQGPSGVKDRTVTVIASLGVSAHNLTASAAWVCRGGGGDNPDSVRVDGQLGSQRLRNGFGATSAIFLERDFARSLDSTGDGVVLDGCMPAILGECTPAMLGECMPAMLGKCMPAMAACVWALINHLRTYQEIDMAQ